MMLVLSRTNDGTPECFTMALRLVHQGQIFSSIIFGLILETFSLTSSHLDALQYAEIDEKPDELSFRTAQSSAHEVLKKFGFCVLSWRMN